MKGHDEKLPWKIGAAASADDDVATGPAIAVEFDVAARAHDEVTSRRTTFVEFGVGDEVKAAAGTVESLHTARIMVGEVRLARGDI